MKEGKKKTIQIKAVIIINLIYIAFFGILLGNITFSVLSEIYYYQILKIPIDPMNPPLTLLGILLIGFYLIPTLLFLLSTYLLLTSKRSGRKITNLTSLIGIWSLFPLTLVTGVIQLYTLNYHQESKNLLAPVE